MRKSQPPVRFLLVALLGAALVGTALGVPRRNFPIGIALSPRGDLALIGNEERAGEVLALPELKLVRVLEAEKGSYARWHPKEPRVALFSSHLWIYSTDPWRLVHHSVADFADVAFHGDKPQLVGLQKTSETADRAQWSLMVVGLDPNPQMSTFPIPDPKPNRIVYAGDDQILVMGTDGRCSLWDLSSHAAVSSATIEGMLGPLAVDASLAETRRLAAWVSQDTGRAGIIALPGLEAVHSFDAHKRGYAEALRFSPDGGQLVTAAGFPESTLKLWDVATGALLGKKTGMQVLDLAWSTDGKTLYLCDRRNEQPSALAAAELTLQP